MVESSVEDLAGVSPHRSPHHMVMDDSIHVLPAQESTSPHPTFVIFHRQDFWYNHFHQRIQFVHRNNNLRYFTGQLFTMNMKGRSSFQDTQEKCCSIEMVEEPEEKFRFRYKSEMQVNKCCRRRRRRTK